MHGTPPCSFSNAASSSPRISASRARRASAAVRARHLPEQTPWRAVSGAIRQIEHAGNLPRPPRRAHVRDPLGLGM
jgi:hypothetical protein